MTENEIKMRAFGSSLSRIGSSILDGIAVKVKWILDESALGYTGAGTPPVINVAWNNEEFMSKMTESEKDYFRTGVFAHELLHQIFTNFAYSNKICDKLSQAEAAIFMKFANTLEDPAIEYFAPDVMGNKLVAPLKYSIAVIYQASPPISETKHPFVQLLNALINFGDCGIVKGGFTFPEAEEYFYKVAPLYNEGITCPDSKKRLDIAKECMEITRPLWEEYVKEEEEWEKLLKELLEFLKKHGRPIADEESLKGDSKSEKARARGMAVKGMPAEGGEETDEEGGEGSGSEEDDAERSESDNDSGSSSNSKSDSSKSGSSETSSEDENDKDSKDGDATSDADEKASASGSRGSGGAEVPAEMEADEILSEDLIIDDNLLEKIEEEIKAEEKTLEKEDSRKRSTSDESIPDFEIDSQYFKHATCMNKRVVNASAGIAENYKNLVSQYSWEIKTLTKALAKIFSADKEEDIRATSGTYNIKRGTIGCTARIMDKRRDPSNKKDACVLLCVDLSGSMNGAGKITQARRASIVFAEALNRLNIPYYIMGYHADCGAQAVHNHYVTWTGKGRETLATMTASNNNFDGYSIRYAGKLIESRPETNKLMFIISDGEPACRTYRSFTEGDIDTKDAVREVRKKAMVYGIALGDCETETLQGFYGKDFVHCEDAELLTNTLAKKLVKTFKGR